MSTGRQRGRWLVLGAEGMLGRDLTQVLAARGVAVTGMDLPSVDITDPVSVEAALEAVRPEVVVNAAAYTAVDAAESDEDAALRVNGEGPHILASAVARRAGTRLVHMSTDYVFSGDSATPYPEQAEPDPRSAYGRTKLVGESAVMRALPHRSYVIRTAWLYGAHGPNFVRTMLELEATRPHVAVVRDQWGQPTWTRDLAGLIHRIARADAPAGIYHGTASGETTWYGLAREVFRLTGADPERVRPTTTDQVPRPARRPAYSVLGHASLRAVGISPLRDWQHALAEALPAIRAGASTGDWGGGTGDQRGR